MFKKILVANRGEIACRVFSTAKKMGIKTVAIYSDADAQALHTRTADEAVCIGGLTAAESYLQIDKVIDACRKSGADAVHPGYGFLSEQAAFAERLAAEGIAFIGPSPSAMLSMGDKITSKKLSSEAGVNTVPGFMGIIDDAQHCVKIASEIGYPVMIKASAGGGGKGMRIAWNDAEALEGFERSKSEAKSSFGDDRIFVEKFITSPRHIEIQVLADSHGNCLYLGERECSIQRRNQKVVEEAPSPFLDEATRRAMGEQAVALSRAVDYVSAGTVEFIVDSEKQFYFLEMNTRLQVEHPVTELITGIDLVEQMIRVAAGEKLGLTQDEVKLNGWAIESRLYAEDPKRGFLPSIGRLSRYRPPVSGASDELVVRNDTGVDEGGEISMYYDPMIAKLCTWSPTREAAIDAMSRALDQFELEGVGNNLQFLSAIMNHPRFKSGNISTAFIEEEYPDGFNDVEPPADIKKLFAMAAAVIARKSIRSNPQGRQSNVMSGARANGRHVSKVLIAGEQVPVTLIDQQDHYQLEVEGQQLRVSTDWVAGNTILSLLVDDKAYDFKLSRRVAAIGLEHGGYLVKAQVLSERKAELALLMPVKQAADMSRYLLCPMPGLVTTLLVKEGDKIEPGQPLAIVEAMKMENVLQSEVSGVVSSVPVAAGDSLQVDDIIMEFET
ncbi:acetyl-CoA carboxylase biotin carboxylase subunit [Granulosicoccus antarcticus]|uniref:Biotin carboxylase n=1 Tax=Granulosicoccus antarcticus IMCC3135 TaxID=1192854 RepID=A0A2Z2NRW1_9GAMM|nr:acetyl/propionyl/methylcrotonyl-CoA carboxylase subunit alpha [Granulosicoccus antarcticus]ASJ73989.1 Acetyl-/propionyl-coenzyme A carboxylase alpha chain [Granulosicoccus antarcticus IMCC3135]